MASGCENGTGQVASGVATASSAEADTIVPTSVASVADAGVADARVADEASGVKIRRALKLSTVSHTLDEATAQRLRHFAFRERISESAVIEHSLRELFEQGDDSLLGRRLRDRGAGLRRKT